MSRLTNFPTVTLDHRQWAHLLGILERSREADAQGIRRAIEQELESQGWEWRNRPSQGVV